MILITGAIGQIGSLVVEHLLNMNVPVRVFVRDKNAFKDFHNSSLEMTEGTFEDRKTLKKAVKGVELLF
ncbi:SDR family oxidoreductase [Oceanobacillus locisalsi]|uniref:SDR family oxidoreductase n=1 Tax=Oceanobacillus locisalsi TaxID=546107 RepID=A0ABW3NEA3_9BACI